MFDYFKKPKVTFLTDIPAALYSYPIVPARQLKPAWFTEDAKDFAEKINKGFSFEAPNFGTIARCKGISKLFKTGWVLRSWQDIIIDANNDGDIRWKTPIDQTHFGALEAVSFHDNASFAKCPHLKDKIPIVKIQTPWTAFIPDGYSMMQLPIQYEENNVFTTASGIFSSEFGAMQLNVQLFWHERTPTLIKAGTPLAHLILIKDEKLDVVIRESSLKERDMMITQSVLKRTGFKANYNAMLESIKNYKTKNKFNV